MTRNQLSAMIRHLLNRSEAELRSCKEVEVNGDSWVSHMTASIILSDIAGALMEARNTAFEEERMLEKEIDDA